MKFTLIPASEHQSGVENETFDSESFDTKRLLATVSHYSPSSLVKPFPYYVYYNGDDFAALRLLREHIQYYYYNAGDIFSNSNEQTHVANMVKAYWAIAQRTGILDFQRVSFSGCNSWEAFEKKNQLQSDIPFAIRWNHYVFEISDFCQRMWHYDIFFQLIKVAVNLFIGVANTGVWAANTVMGREAPKESDELIPLDWHSDELTPPNSDKVSNKQPILGLPYLSYCSFFRCPAEDLVDSVLEDPHAATFLGCLLHTW